FRIRQCHPIFQARTLKKRRKAELMGPKGVTSDWMGYVALRVIGAARWPGLLRTRSSGRPLHGPPLPMSTTTCVLLSPSHLLGVEHQAGEQHLNRRPFPSPVTASPEAVPLLGLPK